MGKPVGYTSLVEIALMIGKKEAFGMFYCLVSGRHHSSSWRRRLPMARVWPPSKTCTAHLPQEEDIDVPLPPYHVQDRLLGLYFRHVHPMFPVIRKSRFLEEYNSR